MTCCQRFLVAAGFAAILCPTAGAQSSTTLLQLRPNSGDTLRMRVDQTIEIDAGARPGRSSAPDVASVVMLARLAIESTDQDGANVVVMSDSVRVSASRALESSAMMLGVKSLRGKHLRFRILPDGATVMTGTDHWGASVGSLFSQVPATLPREPVSPGATWSRAVNIPLAAAAMAPARLNATFRFDSLSRAGEFAYLTVSGRLQRSGPLQNQAGSSPVREATGEVSGKITIDLRRGWITDARSVVSVDAVETGRGRASSMRTRVKITQWMRAL
ncbi:MAG: hypothetical protein ACT4OZ_10565 [Gemmatimonadota bacterium]